jgi:DNA repair exonuclease SbcCD nuclease subunit
VPNRPVFYAGNLQGRNPRETGAKGGYLVEAHAGAPAEPEFVALSRARWERIEIADLPQTDIIGVLFDHVADRIASERTGVDGTFALRCVLTGPSPLALSFREDAARRHFEAVIANRTGALEVQLRTEGLALPFDRRVLNDAPTVVSTALELIVAAREDPGLLAELAPGELLTRCDDANARTAYLAELLADLDEELIQRSVAEDQP